MITIPGNQFITRHPYFSGKSIKSFSMIPNSKLVLDGTIVHFESKWNCCRHFLGLMSMFEHGIRMAERLN